MKNITLLKRYSGIPLEHLPEDVQNQLNADEALKAEFEQQARVAQLISLKGYEVPDDAMFGRVHHRAHLQISYQEHLPRMAFFSLWPAWARATAVIVFMLGLSVLTHREMLRTEEEDPVVATPSPQVMDLSTPLFLPGSDPFQPYQVTLSQDGMDEFPSALTLKLEEDFEALGLTEINRLQPSVRLPVMFPADK